MNIRVGQGVDVHAWQEGRPLILGGVEIPHTHGLQGHSDADALTHAIMDALLGAAGLGDIGHWFPDNDPAFRGASSIRLLKMIVGKLADKKWEIVNIDSTIMAQNPKMAPHIDEMRKTLAEALGVSKQLVSIKATTTEKLGFVGREEGMMCLATVLIKAR